MCSSIYPYGSRIDLSSYDCTPSLTADELQIASRWAEGAVITQRQLPRLYTPLADVLLHDGMDRINRLRSIRFVLTEVGLSKIAYWAWGERRWLDLIDQTPTHPKMSMMPQMTALAYLLCNVRGFHDLKRNITPAPAARLVFGTNLFDRECDRVITALQQVGFKRGDLRSFMPALVAAVALEGGDPRLVSFDKAVMLYLTSVPSLVSVFDCLKPGDFASRNRLGYNPKRPVLLGRERFGFGAGVDPVEVSPEPVADLDRPKGRLALGLDYLGGHGA